MTESIQATGWHVLIELIEVSQTTASGIYVSSNTQHDTEQKGEHRGVVINFGPQAFSGYRGIDDDLDAVGRAAQWGVKIGDIVEVGRYAGVEVNIDNKNDWRMLIQDSKIMGVISNE